MQEISDNTKIGVRLLKAIEDEQFQRLPGGIFDKSFLRQYARYLGMDEDQIVSEYLEMTGASPEPEPVPREPVQEKKGINAAALSAASAAGSSSVGYPRLIFTAVLLGVVVAAIFYGARQFTEGRRVLQKAAARLHAAGVLKPSSLPPEQTSSNNPVGMDTASPAQGQQSSLLADNTGRAAGAAAPASMALGATPGGAAGGLQLQIDARKEVWISISADGRKQWQGMLVADGVRKAQARDSLRLTVGDAAAVSLTLNGKTLPSLGRSGEVKTLSITAAGQGSEPRVRTVPKRKAAAPAPQPGAAFAR